VFQGELYKNCNQSAEDALQEGKMLYDKYQLGRKRWTDAKYAQELHSHSTVVYDVVTKSDEEEMPKSVRLWPPITLWQETLRQL
jgi:hypothetical protein